MKNAVCVYWMLTVILYSAVLHAESQPHSKHKSINFNQDIRPILADKCYHCHGPDSQKRESDLRLDTQAGLFNVHNGSVAFKPGELNQSAAWLRIIADMPDDRMPPVDSKKTLSDKEKVLIKQWILEGAQWNDHWAFVKLKQTQVPDVKLRQWPKNPIDNFVLSRLESSGFSPARQAKKATLIRRVTLDLTGLPPTPVEVKNFIADQSDDAYEKLVDRLLNSKRYGERMAWDWLEAARYADTDGYQGDPTRTMWPWRDWLIKALNENMPFDQFTKEMLAGDLLKNPTPAQIIATGFNRNHMHNGEGGRIAEETRVENIFDRTETTSTVWLGLTMTCARCHDHKYDPISQKEYYQLFAFFNNTSESGKRGGGKAEPVISYFSKADRNQLHQLNSQISIQARKLAAPDQKLDKSQAAWELNSVEKLQKFQANSSPIKIENWSILGPIPVSNVDQSKLFDIKHGPEDNVNLSATYQNKYAWKKAPKLISGKVYPLPEIVGTTYLFSRLNAQQSSRVELSLGSDDGIVVWLNGKKILTKNVSRAAAADQEKVQLKLNQGKNDLLIKIVNSGGIGGVYYRIVGESIAEIPFDIAKLLKTKPESRNQTVQQKIQTYYRKTYSPQWRKLEKEYKKLVNLRNQMNKAAPRVMVMDSLPGEKQRLTKVLNKGIYNQPKDILVSAAVPSFMHEHPIGRSANRLTLANWLASPQNPLTARVTVNRYWQTFFGIGLVKTSEDFGKQGDLPSHPKLLDWLAYNFIKEKWNVKKIHKTIVTSATYQQSSHAEPTVNSSYTDDPENRLLSRGPRFRMPSWMLRDQALFLSGLLVEKMGGPAVKPYQPPGVWGDATFGKIRYSQDKGENLYRRSLYIFWRRIIGPTMFFDSGKRQTCKVNISRTNTPLHALTTLNETTFVESARAMGEKIMSSGGDSPEERISYAFLCSTARQPDQQELKVLVNRWIQAKKSFEDNPVQARKFLSVGESKRDLTLNQAEHAAYAVICSLLMNLDEVLTKE